MDIAHLHWYIYIARVYFFIYYPPPCCAAAINSTSHTRVFCVKLHTHDVVKAAAIFRGRLRRLQQRYQSNCSIAQTRAGCCQDIVYVKYHCARARRNWAEELVSSTAVEWRAAYGEPRLPRLPSLRAYRRRRLSKSKPRRLESR